MGRLTDQERRWRAETEAGWQAVVVDYARHLGWTVAHFRPAMTAEGWRTPVQYDGAGFPDLTLVRERAVFVELKTELGKLRPQQEAWIKRLEDAGQEVYVWRPSDWGRVQEVLEDYDAGGVASAPSSTTEEVP